MTGREIAGVGAFLALLLELSIALALNWPLEAQTPAPVTPTVTLGPGALPFAWGVDTQAHLPVGPLRAGFCMSTWDTGRVWCWTSGAAWASPSGGGGGGGTVTSFGVSGLPWLSVANPTTAPVLSPASGQTAGLVIGTCGAATTVSLCAMTAGMVPALPYLPTSTTYAASSSVGGAATTAVAAASTPTPCSSGSAPTGVTSAWNSSGCTAYAQDAGDLGGTAASPQVVGSHLAAPLPHAQGGTDQAAATDSGTLIANGTVFQLVIYPNCADTAGQHLNYTASTHTISCGTSSSGGGGSPGGTSGQLQYNSSGAFTGDTATTDGAGNLAITTLAVGTGPFRPVLSDQGDELSIGTRRFYAYEVKLCGVVDCAGVDPVFNYNQGGLSINSLSSHNWDFSGSGGTGHVTIGANGGISAVEEKWVHLEVGAPVASAASITPPSALFHVTGTSVVSTIVVPYTGFTGCVRIIPDAAFATTTAGGNIALASTATVGRVLLECYDGTSWYPSY